jgi:CheY-like chemotaxis protein
LRGDESWRLLLELRGQEGTGEIPIIITSATGEVRKALHLGADDYLAKPLDRERLIEALDKATGQHSLTRVLLVDDEEVIHYLVRQLLPRSRYRLWIARNGGEALDRLPEYRPDVILFDLSMPGNDGSDLLKRLRQDARSAATPMIVLTSVVLKPEERALLSSTTMIMSKAELAPDTLIKAIDRALRAEAGIGAE